MRLSKLAILFSLALFYSSAWAGHILPTPRPAPFVGVLAIDQTRLVVLDGEIGDGIGDDISGQIKKLDRESARPIYFVIATRGGAVNEGEKIIEAMESARSKVICVVDHEAYSMGAVIATFCPRLYIQKFASIMFHLGTWAISGPPPITKARLEWMARTDEVLDRNIAANLGITYEDYIHRIHDEWWLTSYEAASLGISDGVLNKLDYPTPEKHDKTILEILTGGMFPNGVDTR